MQLHNYEERYFWKNIYLAAVQRGSTGWTAKQTADLAVEDLRQTPVVKPTPNRLG